MDLEEPCKEGFYVLRQTSNATSEDGSVIPTEAFKSYEPYSTTVGLPGQGSSQLTGSLTSGTSSLVLPCLPCHASCKVCIDGTPCRVTYNLILRSSLLGFESFCATICILLSIVIFRLRKDKDIAASRWIMLEMILLGALSLYLTIIVRYFEPTPSNCLVEPWLREVGFGLFYGSIIIKLYRILAEFQTRKAHRVCVRDKDLLKYLASIIMVIVGYLAAWTALILDAIDGFNNISGKVASTAILYEGSTSEGLHFLACKELSWNYVTETGEILFLLSGVYITYCIRNARSEIYKEKWTLCWIVYLELVVSTITYALRHLLYQSLHPDYLYLMYFIRCQLTVSLALIFLLVPKLWYHSHPHSSVMSKKRSRYFSSCDVENRVPEAMKLHSAVLSNGELDIGEINLADMDPDEIRSELRRIYTQLQILKNNTMRKDNPHISKRRGGRKCTHRRFSLQPFSHKPSSASQHHHHQHSSHDKQGHDYNEQTEISRTPEESTGSGEANAEISGPGAATATSSSGRKSSGTN